MRTFTPTSDKQLWRIVDVIDGKECAWPLYCTPGTEFNDRGCFLVELAVPAESAIQWKFASSRITPISFDADGTRWLVRRSHLEKSAIKCEGVTPEFYLKWNSEISGNDSATESVESSGKSVDCRSNPEISGSDDFIRYVCAETGETNVPQMRILFAAICEYAMRWIVDEQKPLKFQFCTLRAVPYRRNWQGILHARWPNILATFRKKNTRELLEAIGFMDSLHSSDMIEMNGKTFGWSIEAVHEEKFDKHIEKLESETLAGATPTKYLSRWSKLVADNYEAILEIFGAFLSKASRPLGSVVTPLNTDRAELAPKTSRGSVRPAPVWAVPTRFTTAPHDPVREPVTPSIAPEISVEEVPPVSDV